MGLDLARACYHPRMTRRLERSLFWTAVATLLVAHMFSLEQGERALVLGWIPVDMAYRVVWMGCAAGLVAWMTTRLWPEPREAQGRDRARPEVQR